MSTKNSTPIQCAGCVVSKSFNQLCDPNCPVLLGHKTNKYTTLIQNYKFIMAYRNNK